MYWPPKGDHFSGMVDDGERIQVLVAIEIDRQDRARSLERRLDSIDQRMVNWLVEVIGALALSGSFLLAFRRWLRCFCRKA